MCPRKFRRIAQLSSQLHIHFHTTSIFLSSYFFKDFLCKYFRTQITMFENWHKMSHFITLCLNFRAKNHWQIWICTFLPLKIQMRYFWWFSNRVENALFTQLLCKMRKKVFKRHFCWRGKAWVYKQNFCIFSSRLE